MTSPSTPVVHRALDDYWIDGKGHYPEAVAEDLLTQRGYSVEQARTMLSTALRGAPAPGFTGRIDVAYEVEGGDYPYRIDGLRLSYKEATDYLVARRGYATSDAYAAVNLAKVDAANAATPPGVELFDDLNSRYRLDGERVVSRGKLVALLELEYRRTPAEVEAIIQGARDAAFTP